MPPIRSSTAISPAAAGGDAMDEAGFDDFVAAPVTRKRPIVVKGGVTDKDALEDLYQADPPANAWASPVRVIGQPSAPGTLIIGQLDVDVVKQLPAHACRKVHLRALGANPGIIWVGADAAVDVTNGFPLFPGDGIDLDLANSNLVWVAADAGLAAVPRLSYLVT